MSNNSRNALANIYFKPTIGGFVFQAPKPWVFGAPRHYLANEAQKSEILSIVAPEVPAWRRVAIITALITGPVVWALAIAILLWAVSDHDEPAAREIIVMAVLIVGPILAALFLAIAWTAQSNLAKLAPLIAQLAPTQDQITTTDRRREMARGMSMRTMVLIIGLNGFNALISAFVLGMRVTSGPVNSAPTALILVNLLIAIGVMASYTAMMLRKVDAAT